MVFARGHLTGIHQFAVQRPELERAHHVPDLVERRVRALERASHLGLGVGVFVPDSLHEEVDGLLGRHLFEVE